MYNSTNTVVHFDERWQFMFTDARKVSHNLCDAVDAVSVDRDRVERSENDNSG